jgi:hypothetical protein
MTRDDPVAMLERELVAAARRMNATDEPSPRRPTGAHEPASERPGVRGRPGVRPGGLGAGISLAASVLVVLAVGSAFLLTGHSGSKRAASPLQTMVDSLAVLRRPQTPADRDPATLQQIVRIVRSDRHFTPDLGLMRLAATTPWRARVVLVPFTVTTSVAGTGSLRRGARASGAAGAKPRWESARNLLVFVRGSLWGAGTAGAIRDHGILARVTFYRSSGMGVVLVVPDGVTKVAFAVPGLRVITAGVKSNVAAFRVPTQRAVLVMSASSVTWFGPGGRVLKRNLRPGP